MASSVLCGRGEKGAPLLTQRDVQRVSATVRACALQIFHHRTQALTVTETVQAPHKSLYR